MTTWRAADCQNPVGPVPLVIVGIVGECSAELELKRSLDYLNSTSLE
jgi:hypothetical protein